ncbi:MAG: ATP phosphoribosyltransferase regulatory subunit [Gammaproteobacteria bacterium]|nr:ATP phosphoribosyltransferase regulatory subunit [Rhodocyclaceae bacterium]MBU3908753.1 ATP phosphoribosyltransferase regulatory subunit [Gammaproteobacteria bacterium]MBU3989193.1 ATP phosphoribosyltransferase regulatory subunit [Gammaproteobacteria bacterium]MBU4004781.1 ATP phosphoribosyltransferase regulatory subunit [Gammaproteobacteria bacterium]MBU4021384.1 ATP phosphoribosyltransferase regulatory subunit [Gammaproteobacteria bacterium]
MTHTWLLPEAIEDLLPAEAAQVEHLRRHMLDEFVRHGYQLVAPPMLEFADALLAESGRDLDLRSFKLVDQLSGRTLALRADITPQVSRIDAHLLNRRGVTRLCYCGSVLHTRPSSLLASREPLQIGAELYGHADIEADHEVIRLLARSLQLAELPPSRIDLGHVGIFRALTAGLKLAPGLDQQLFEALQAKDLPTLRELTVDLPATARDGLLTLPTLYGGVEVLTGAAVCLPGLPEISSALADLLRLANELEDLPLSFDLADLRGYHYHSGVVFAAYCDDSPTAVALGGRYDSIGARYGRARSATGFSLDLRALARLSSPQTAPGAILAPWPEDAAWPEAAKLQDEIERLRASGEVVIAALPGHSGSWREAGCDRQLTQRNDKWIIEPLEEN